MISIYHNISENSLVLCLYHCALDHYNIGKVDYLNYSANTYNSILADLAGFSHPGHIQKYRWAPKNDSWEYHTSNIKGTKYEY